MIHFTKKFYAMMFVVFCMSNIMQSHDMSDEEGRTEIMNYVIAIEKEIALKKSELEKLWSTYFYTKITVTNNALIKDTGMQYYDFTTLRKAYTTEADVEHYKKVKDEYNSFIKDIRDNIKSMVLDGANLQARDVKGKSVSDYCCSWEMYDILHELGAPRTLNQEFWGAIVGGVVITSSGAVIITAAAVVATACYRACFPQ
ncbi:hypothetical protein [Candidatus Chromulinivorax destructor]|uniref:Uncharacterized protein n=1 Tax=Candidatus Chromulinivorax destructor TaxID=2066483 RepID=A0A345ZCM0_9BACT|nr:hypothetical protein [Candidatus Chromulinivorax destructor]AXK61037.1 hypothetical protein C0J27_04880 [Candidatus Chromulinivorax destructor]